MNVNKRYFARTLLAEIRAAMESTGCQYIGRSWYERPLSATATGVVTLPLTSYKGDPALYIVPGLGVRHEQLERLLVELSGEAPGKFLPASIHTSLEKLTHSRGHAMLTFDHAQDIRKRIAETVVLVHRYGFSWMEENQTLEAILARTLEFKYSTRDQARFRIPLIYYLKDDPDSALLWLDRGLAEIGPDQNTYAEKFRRFGNALRHCLTSA